MVSRVPLVSRVSRSYLFFDLCGDSLVPTLDLSELIYRNAVIVFILATEPRLHVRPPSELSLNYN